jgi:hypothetical protein
VGQCDEEIHQPGGPEIHVSSGSSLERCLSRRFPLVDADLRRCSREFRE